MSRLNIEHVAFDPEHDPARAPATALVLETIEALYELRAARAKLLRRAAHEVDDEDTAGRFLQLARKLSSRRIHSTLADPLCLHEYRRSLSSGVWAFLKQREICDTAQFVTVIPRDAQYQGNAPIPIDPNRLKLTLRAGLDRCGARHADGFLILWFEGDYHPESGTGQMHGHGFVGGGMVDVMHRLRNTDKFLSERAASSRPRYPTNLGVRVANPIRFRRPLFNLPYPVLYCLKQRWSARPVDTTGESGEWSPLEAKAKPMRRVAEAYSLLWRDDHSLQDLTLMMGMYVGASGLALSK